jgi:hypothetical protein
MRLLLFLFILPLCTRAQDSGPLTNQQVIQLVQSGVPTDELLRIISTAPAVSFHLAPTDTDLLMRAGVSEQTIKAMSARERGLVFPTGPSSTAGVPIPRVSADRTNEGAGTANESPAGLSPNVPGRINIIVVEGEGVTGAVRQRALHDPVVMIEDDDHRPIAGAVVVFGLPVSGTSGEFSNGTKNLMLMTDQSGRAIAHGLKANEVPGKLQINVMASYHALRARTMINQRIEGRPGGNGSGQELQASKSDGKWKWVVLGVAAAGGAVAGVHFGTRTASSSPVSISTSTVVVGGPR